MRKKGISKVMNKEEETISDHSHLSRAHLRTLEQVFQHPIAHNLEWREVVSLFEAEGQVEDHNNHLKVTLNGETQTFPRPPQKDVATEQEILDMRHFLEKVGITPQLQQAEQFKPLQPWPHLLVVITHHETKIFETDFTRSETDPEVLQPADPLYRLHHLHHKQGNFQGQYAPEDPAYYEDIVEDLNNSQAILIFGNATGHSSAMEYLVNYLQQHHSEIVARIIGTVKVDVEALTDQQLLAEARSFYSQKVGSE